MTTTSKRLETFLGYIELLTDGEQANREINMMTIFNFKIGLVHYSDHIWNEPLHVTVMKSQKVTDKLHTRFG